MDMTDLLLLSFSIILQLIQLVAHKKRDVIQSLFYQIRKPITDFGLFVKKTTSKS